MIASGPWAYFSSLENLLQDLIIILTASFIAVAPENTEIGTHLAGWAVFCAWVSDYIYTHSFLFSFINKILGNEKAIVRFYFDIIYHKYSHTNES